MWQAPNQRIRALASIKRREREKQRRPLHIKRVQAELKLVENTLGKPATIAMARVMLNDLSATGVGLFSPIALHAGQEVQLTIEEPKRFFVRGKIVWCQEYDMNSHVLSRDPYSFRIGIEFEFESAEEEKQVREHCAFLIREHVFTEK